MDGKPVRNMAISAGEARFKTLVETMGDGLSEIDETFVTTYANATLCRMLGRSMAEIIGRKVEQFLDDENRQILYAQREKRRKGATDPYEIVWTRKDGSRLHTIMTPTPYFDDQGHFKGSFAIITDISKQKKEKNILEQMVKERTRELENQTSNLEEVNTALRVLLKKRQEDQSAMEQRMLINVKELVLPYIERVRETRLDERQQGCLDVVESTLNDIVSPFMTKLSLEFRHLTPSETQVANLVKFGKTTKEIAEILNLSHKTIEFYRKRIRKKVGITHRNINLRTYLLSL